MNDLLTDRLAIHPFTPGEAELVAAADRRPHTNWAPDYPSEGEQVGAQMFLKACAAVGDPHPFGCYEIRRRSDGQAIGGIGFHGAPDEQGSVEVGYGLAESARGQGYAREALRAILELARSHGVTTLLADTDPDNLPSQRVLLAVGMELVGEGEELKRYRLTLG